MSVFDDPQLVALLKPLVVEFENETLERAALVADSFEDNDYNQLNRKTRHLTAQAIAREIRALKNK